MGNHRAQSGNEPQTVSTTETSLSIIEVIRANDGARTRELTEELDLAKSTVHAHLQTLQKSRYVTKEGEQYHLGFKFFELGEYVTTRKELYKQAEEQITKLQDNTGYVTDFSVEEHGRVISLYSDLYHTQSSFLSDRRTVYMHNTAAGKAILAELSDSRIQAVLDRWGLPQETERAITTPDELWSELETTRERGYAVNDEESISGLYSIAMPVLHSSGHVYGAISLDCPKYRVNGREIEDMVTELGRTVDDLEQELEDGMSF
jgi:IclR family acetate operon transcriptional repressor